jgi:Protein of unknown function (DUF3007)
VHCVSCIFLKIIAAHKLPYLLQAKQLKDYENAVIAKRLEELDDDEIEALVEEVNKDKF